MPGPNGWAVPQRPPWQSTPQAPSTNYESWPTCDAAELVQGTPVTAGRAVLIDVGGSGGNVVLELLSGNQITVNVAENTLYEFNWAVVELVSASATLNGVWVEY